MRSLRTLLVIVWVVVANGCWIRTFDASKRPDLVLVTVDTLRADHLELHGHPRATSPALTRLGRAGIVFRNAVAQAPWTLPSMASLHTGQPPSIHGAVDSQHSIAMTLPTLAELLRAQGYRTQAVVSHAFVGTAYGFARGFEDFDETLVQGHDGSSSQALTQTALAYFDRASDAPTFLWVHYFDPHYSYTRHPEYGFATGPRGRFADTIAFATPDATELLDLSRVEQRYMVDVYDEEIAHTDHWIGQLVDGVREADRDRAAIFVVTSDHGEAFLERGRLGHGRDLYDELIHVPLIVGGDIDRTMRGITVGRPVETSAIATTLLRLAGVADHAFPGVDLIDTAQSRRIPPFALSEGSYARGSDGRQVSVQQGSWKLIHHLDADRYELYNHASDPEEHNDLIEDPKKRAKRILLQSVVAPRSEAIRAMKPDRDNARPHLDPGQHAKLRALGYLDHGDGNATTSSDGSETDALR